MTKEQKQEIIRIIINVATNPVRGVSLETIADKAAEEIEMILKEVKP